MVSYDVTIVTDAEDQLASYIEYLLYVKRNSQAAKAVYTDAVATKDELTKVAGSLKLCDNEK